MSAQMHAKKSSGKRKTYDTSEDPKSGRATEEAAALKEELDDVLDAIDAVLEENAEEFVKNYVQKNGE